jgi:nitrate reductase alpha subunit
MQLSRRNFIAGTAVLLPVGSLQPASQNAASESRARHARQGAGKEVKYNDYSDIWREKWKWDKVVKGTHTRANCGDACSWDVYVRDGIAWREEQNAIYEPHRADVPDMNPRGCQKGACYTTLQLSEGRQVSAQAGGQSRRRQMEAHQLG